MANLERVSTAPSPTPFHVPILLDNGSGQQIPWSSLIIGIAVDVVPNDGVEDQRRCIVSLAEGFVTYETTSLRWSLWNMNRVNFTTQPPCLEAQMWNLACSNDLTLWNFFNSLLIMSLLHVSLREILHSPYI